MKFITKIRMASVRYRPQFKSNTKKYFFRLLIFESLFPSELFSYHPTQSVIEMQIQSTSLACVYQSIKLTTYCTISGETKFKCLLMQMIRCKCKPHLVCKHYQMKLNFRKIFCALDTIS